MSEPTKDQGPASLEHTAAQDTQSPVVTGSNGTETSEREAVAVVAGGDGADGDKDVAMADATEASGELVDYRLSLLQSVNAESEAFPWRQFTDEGIKDLTALVDEFILRLDNEPAFFEDIFYEAIYIVKYHPDRVSIADVASVLNKILEINNPEPYYLKFIAIFNTFEVDKNLRELIKKFTKLPSIDLLKYLSDETVLKQLNLLKDSMKTSYILQLIEQRRYFLLHEANEGYAKVVALFNEVLCADDSHFQVNYLVKAIERLIGHFSLDTVRTLDLIIEIASNSITRNYRFILEYFKNSQWWPTNPGDISSLDTLNHGGNEIAAKLIGKKLRNYVEQEKDSSETLKILIAMLIKEGFVSFASIYQYLGPDEGIMEQLKEETEKTIEDEIFKASANALALSGPLADDDEEDTNSVNSRPASKKEIEKKKNVEVKQLNQKLIYLKIFLANGLYYPALYILNKYPFLAHVDNEVPQLLIRLFNVIIEPLKRKFKVLSPEDQTELKVEAKIAISRSKTGSDEVAFDKFTYNEIEVFNPLKKSHTNKIFKYFYYEWSEMLPKASTCEELTHFANEFLVFIGPKFTQDLSLISYLSKFGVDDLESSQGDANYDENLNKWFLFYRKFILPGSTSINDNPITISDIYKLLGKFPLDWRYNLYGDLYTNISKRDQFVRLNYSKAEKQTKDVLKRITTENVSPMMRRLAKITFSNPLPAFFVIVSQVESYDNLTTLIVDAARYFTDYAWDVLPFVLLIRLTDTKRVAVQSDGLNDSPWLQSLATFIAKLAKQYASFNLEPILNYVVKDLHKNNTVGLSILREVVNQMGGIQQNSNLSIAQIKLLNSSESLQKLVRKVILDTRDSSKVSGLRLLNTLIKSKQLSEVFVLLSDFHRNLIEKSTENGHYKVLSSQNDEISSVLHTFIALVTFFLKDDKEKFVENIVGVQSLISDYQVDIAWAFEIWRDQLEIVDESLYELEIKDVDFTDLSKNLFVDFWKLSLYDINYSDSAYDTEYQKLESSTTAIKEQLTSLRGQRQVPEVVAERAKLNEQLEYNKQTLETLAVDRVLHKEHDAKVREALDVEKIKWFETEVTVENLQSFIQSCMVPRAIHSESDAVFTASFIDQVLDIETSEKVLNILFESDILDTLLYTLTPLESENLGLFVAEIFTYNESIRKQETSPADYKKSILRWHSKTLGSIKVNIESENYMSRRNTFTFLKNLIGVYPVVEDHGEAIIENIKRVSSREKRQDLKLASDAILAHITSHSKSWIHLWDFASFDEEEKKELEQKRDELVKEREERAAESKRLAMLKAKEEARIREEARAKAKEEERQKREEEERLAREAREAEEREREEKEAAERAKSAKGEPNRAVKEENEEGDEEEVLEEEDEDDEEVLEEEDENEKEESVKEEPEAKKEQVSDEKMDTYSSGSKKDEKPTRGKFKDVTASIKSDRLQNAKDDPLAHFKEISYAIRDGQLERLYAAILDPDVVKRLRGLGRNGKQAVGILEEYGLKTFGQSHHYTKFKMALRDLTYMLGDLLESQKPRLPSGPSGGRIKKERTPLLPQSEVGGYQQVKSTKWNVDQRTYNPNDNGSRSYSSSPAQRGQYNQGSYRQSSDGPRSSYRGDRRDRDRDRDRDSKPPPPPPPPPPPSVPPPPPSNARGGRDNFKRNSRDSYSSSGYENKRQRR